MAAIENLRNAVEAAAGSTAFALDAAFLTSGLDDPQVKVPPQYDAWLAQAFFAQSAQAFTVLAAKSNVGPVENGAFTVQSATIPFVGASAPLAAKANLVFSQDDGSLVVQIETEPSGWTWTDSFAFMGAFPFNQFASLAAVRFIFSTATGAYPWNDAKGESVTGGAVQNFSATIPFPDIVRPYLTLFDGLSASSSLVLSGSLDMGLYDGETVLYPPGRLSAAIEKGSFQLLYLTVSDPAVAITIPPPDGSAVAADGSLFMPVAAAPEAGGQAPTLAISSGINVSQNAGPAPYRLDVELVPTPGGRYDIALTATGDGPPLSPSSIISLIGGGGSYFAATPDVLQQFLAFVSLQGFTLAGQLGSAPSVSSAAVLIGSSPNTSWTILPDPTGALDFTITAFSLNWAVLNPFNSALRQQSFNFSTRFILAPAVFKGPDGQGDGEFEVQFTSGKQFFASFTGTAKLSDFLNTLSGGAIVLDSASTGDFELENIALNIDYGAQSFHFSAGFSLSLNLLELNGEPILSIQQGHVSVAAKTPTQTPSGANATTSMLSSHKPTRALVADQAASQTQWQAGIGGFLQVGPFHASASVAYDGFQSPARWNLSSALAQPLAVSALVNQFFDPGGAYDFPDFLSGGLLISAFAVDAVIPAAKGALQTRYDISTAFSWTFTFGDQTVGIDPAKLALAYDGNKPAGQQFSGSAQGTWTYTAINLKLTMGYAFLPTATGTNNILFVEWEGFRAEWQSGNETVTFSLKGWSIGTLIQALVRTLGDPYFTLSSPWDLLNQISLDGLRIAVSLKSGESASQRLSASYVLSSPIELGFIRITELSFRRGTDGQVTLVIVGSSPLQNDPGFQNLFDPTKGQDVKNLPPVPGRGEQWFKLFLLVLGQRIGITGYKEFKDTKDVICALQNVPNTTGKTNPVDPNANKGGSVTKGVPYYDQSNNWLIAAHLGLLKVGNAWSIDVMVVFNDPNLYGLRLALAGAKMGGLANLVIDIVYKKITDDIGLYQIEFSFPDAIRNLNFGAVSITLPQIGIKVYTNGDFFIDIGFPYNLDFRRSFSIAAIIYGVPVLGAGGFYFGKLSNATATSVPKTNLGTFDPVIEFGLGLQLGLGYNFEKGPLKAGFSITVFGIIEGVIAPWHPFDPASPRQIEADAGKALQAGYYFKVSGTVGIIGLLYGSVDFAIISASVNVKIVLSIQISYESYRKIPIVASASVDISLKVKINLGLFSISISLSFSTRVSATFEIGENSVAPWDPQSAALAEPGLRGGIGGPDATLRLARTLEPRPKRLAPAAMRKLGLAAGDDLPTLSLLAGAQYSVLAPEGATSADQNEGAFIFLLAMDAPDPNAAEPPAQPTSFDRLAQAYFPWIIDTLANPSGDEVDLAAILAESVTAEALDAYVARLADNQHPALSIGALLQFLSGAFKLDFENPATAQTSGLKAKLDAGSVLFPVFDGLAVSMPAAAGGGTSAIDFETYATATLAYAAAAAELFDEVAAEIDARNQEPKLAAEPAAETTESMAALVFVDTFTLIARQLLQAGSDALRNYAYPLQADSSIGGIRAALNAVPGNAITVTDVMQPNIDHPLSAGCQLTLANLSYVLQAGDTLSRIAAAYSDPGGAPRWTTTADALIVANQRQHVLQGGVTLALTDGDGRNVLYLTRQGDSFLDIAIELGLTVEALAAQSALYGAAGLLTPTLTVDIPPIAYRTAGESGASTDTLASLASTFRTSPVDIATANQDIPGLFAWDGSNGLLNVAQLQALSVGALWTAIAATGQVAQTAGMVSRFLVYGLRLPNQDGLALSSDFLYPGNQDAFGVYQLTGQQFPVPESAGSYEITLSRAASSHGVDLGFILMNGSPSPSLTVDLSQAYSDLQTVVAWAKTPGNFVPSPSFAITPLARRQARAFSAGGFARWSSASVARLEALTLRDPPAAEDEAGSAQVQPTLWALPPAQTNLVAARQQAIEAVVDGLQATYRLLPHFQPQVGRSNPATGRTQWADIRQWAWCTRIDIEIKRLPDAQALAQQGAGAEDMPSGPASAPSLPFIYELVGPSAAEAVQLERILSAMDSLGEDIASAVFLVYSQTGPGAPLLVTPADSDFLAFITQTNLSTETNPPSVSMVKAAAGKAPRGIANSPAQFVKLLWELSTVRSGGYYLYYENVVSGEGLPAAIFDSSGSGTVSLVMTFAASGPACFGLTLPNFVNAFVTTDPIDPERDAVQTLSVATVGPTAPLAGAPSLSELSAIYGLGAGRIAETNAGATLRTGAEVPIVGATRQLTNADLVRTGQGQIDAEATLAKLAAIYSANAVAPITGADIAAYNPGVTVALAALFYIPPVTYRVDPQAPPGASLASMAVHYGLDIDLIARGAAETAGLFPDQAVLHIDSEMFELRDQLPPQNLGFALERANLGAPPDQSSDPGFAEKTMYQLYTSLAAGLAGNAFFTPSPLGLPFGPQDQGDEAPDEGFHSHARAATARAARLTALAEAPLDYRQSIGLSSAFALVNAAPEPSDPALPAKADNPYIGVGSTAQITLQWRDIFGNVTVTPFEAPSPSYAGALNGAAVPMLYRDELIGLGAWRNTRASYVYEGDGGAALQIGLSLDPKAYQGDDPQQQAEQDLALYTRIYFQLHQDYSAHCQVAVPGIAGNAVTMLLTNSLMAAPATILTDAQAEVVRAYVRGCVIYLAAIASGKSPPDAPAATLAIPIDVAAIAEGNIIEMDVALTLSRNPLLVEPSVAALDNGLSVSAMILPHADTEQGISYSAFSSAFEALFRTDDWYLKIGEGLSRDGEDSASGNQQLWAVRFGTTAGQGIHYEIGTQPSYYAPRPVAKTLESGTATITNYATGASETVHLDGIDLNAWFQAALDAIDQFLSADYAPHVFILDVEDGVEDPLKDGNLGKVLATKESLANAISAKAWPILSTSADDDSTQAAAAEKIRQQLLNQLGAAYRAGAAVVFDLTDVSGANGPDAAGPPSLYGQPRGEVPGAPNNRNFTLTPTRLPLGPTIEKNVSIDPRLAFVLTTKSVADQAYVPLDLELAITHLEFERETVPGIEGYVKSRWLAFVNPPAATELGEATANVPVVNRNLPTPPTVSGQSAAKASQAPPTQPIDLTQWSYAFDYLYQQAASDAVSYTIEFNRPMTTRRAGEAGDNQELLTALAQLTSAWPDILRDLNTYLVQIDGRTPDPAVAAAARKAVTAFAAQTGAVAAAYEETPKDGAHGLAAGPAHILLKFMSTLDATPEGHARTNILDITINGLPASWDPQTNTLTAGTVTLPAMVIAIDAERFAPQTVPPAQLPPGVQIAYLYSHTENGQTTYLSEAQALGIAARTVSLSPLDALLLQSGSASVFVQRNLALFPIGDIGTVSTRDAFLFRSPEVKFANPVVPRLAFDSFALDGLGGGSDDLDALLTLFFAGLYAGGNGSTEVEVSAQGVYRYTLVAGQPAIPRVSLPVALLTPSPSAVSPDVKPAFITPFCAAIEQWRKDSGPSTGGDASIDIELKLFGATGTAQQPIVTVERLTHAVQRAQG